jgi:hypothetical protein
MVAYDGGNLVQSVNDITNGAYTKIDEVLDSDSVENADSVSYYKASASPITAGAFVGTASASGTTLTVSAVTSGSMPYNAALSGSGVPANLWSPSRGSGTGGTGTYVLSATSTISSTTITASNTIFPTYVGFGDYSGCVAMELTGVTTLVGHAAQRQTSIASGSTISSGTAALGSSPVIIVVACINISEAGGTYVPLASSGWTSDGTSWAFDLSQNILRVAHKVVLNPGTTDGNCVAQGSSSDSYITFMAAFK